MELFCFVTDMSKIQLYKGTYLYMESFQRLKNLLYSCLILFITKTLIISFGC